MLLQYSQQERHFFNIKNKKAQASGVAIIVAIFIFIIGMVVVSLFQTDITLARAADGLDCSNSSAISDGTKLTCLTVDLVIPFFMISVFSVVGGLITEKFMRAKK